MALTPAQLTTLKANILANTDPAVIQAITDGANNVIADWYNQLASPAYWLYRNMVTPSEIKQAIDINDMVNITDTDRSRVVDIIAIRSEIGFNGESASDRAAFDDVFSAAAGDNSQQAIAALWKRQGTYAEKVFSLGTDNGNNSANPDTTSFQGTLSFQDVVAALNS